MMEALISTASFLYAFHKVNPTEIVDKVIDVILKTVTPGKGMGESSWWMKGIRHIEQTTERANNELTIRSNLRQWDEDWPMFHHEVIVRYAAGFLASYVSVVAYNFLFSKGGGNSRRYRY